jgi:hypothetical protein
VEEKKKRKGLTNRMKLTATFVRFGDAFLSAGFLSQGGRLAAESLTSRPQFAAKILIS